MDISKLNFKPHDIGIGGTHATIEFDNGYGASIVTGPMFYTSDHRPYELAVLHNGKLTYDTPITEDVLGYLVAAEVESTLDEIAALPEDKS
jgi:hypothetical protein